MAAAAAAADALAASHRQSEADCLTAKLDAMWQKQRMRGEKMDRKALEQTLLVHGNIFSKRSACAWPRLLGQVPSAKLNAFALRVEDEGPFGNDEVRSFVLTHLSRACVRHMACVRCALVLPVYDRFPLIDGTLYLSPVNYFDNNADNSSNDDEDAASNSNDDMHATTTTTTTTTTTDDNDDVGIDVRYDPYAVRSLEISNSLQRRQHMYALCVACMHQSTTDNNTSSSSSLSSSCHTMKCVECGRAWQGGHALQIGTMYKFDIFAAFPCCQRRLDCRQCGASLLAFDKRDELMPHFSSYSKMSQCPRCHLTDYHFVRSLRKLFSSAATATSSLSLTPLQPSPPPRHHSLTTAQLSGESTTGVGAGLLLLEYSLNSS